MALAYAEVLASAQQLPAEEQAKLREALAIMPSDGKPPPSQSNNSSIDDPLLALIGIIGEAPASDQHEQSLRDCLIRG